MKKEIDWKELAKDLQDILYWLKDDYYVCRRLIEFGYSYDNLVQLNFDKDTIEKASADDMNNLDY